VADVPLQRVEDVHLHLGEHAIVVQAARHVLSSLIEGTQSFSSPYLAAIRRAAQPT
jgi:hypothetical protein